MTIPTEPFRATPEIRRRPSTWIETTGSWLPKYRIEVSQYEIHDARVAADQDGTRIAHITDVHHGLWPSLPALSAVLRRLETYKPALVLFTGDYVDDSVRLQGADAADVVAPVASAYDTYASLGNHDHRRGSGAILTQLAAGGATVLVNRCARTDCGLWVAGVDDLGEGRPDMMAAVSGLPRDGFGVLLSHHPGAIETPPAGVGLILSGHTHGGQFRLPFPRPETVVRHHLHCSQVDGWYRAETCAEYVSRGIGMTGVPLRIRCPAEVSLFELRATASGS